MGYLLFGTCTIPLNSDRYRLILLKIGIRIQRQIQGRRTGRAPPGLKKMGVCFWLYMILFNMECLQYVFYSILYYKSLGYVYRGIKTNPRPKNSTAPGPRLTVLKFLSKGGTGAPGASPPPHLSAWNFFGFFLLCNTHINFNCSRQTMFLICILFTFLT